MSASIRMISKLRCFLAPRARQHALGVALIGALSAGAASATDYNEANLQPPDFSNTVSSPTPLTFSLGDNRITGTVVAGLVDQQDFITFTIQPGQQLAAIKLVSYEPNNRGFHALTAGPQSFDPATGIHPAEPHGGNHLGLEPDGADLLPGLARGQVPGGAGPGINRELGPGVYTYVIQQTGTPLVTYTLNFVVSPFVPALPPWGAALVGTLVVAGGWFMLRRTRGAAVLT
jgi:hypothetical protein